MIYVWIRLRFTVDGSEVADEVELVVTDERLTVLKQVPRCPPTVASLQEHLSRWPSVWLVIQQEDPRYTLLDDLLPHRPLGVLWVDEWHRFTPLRMPPGEPLVDYIRRLKGCPPYDWRDAIILLLIALLMYSVIKGDFTK